MNSTDLAFTPAIEQAHLIRNKQISPLELTQLYLSRIERLNPQLGAFFTVMTEQALADAQAKTELLTSSDPATLPPLFGVPISVKDLNPVAGVRCTYGSKVLVEKISDADDGIVTKIRQAGCIILGKTATSEFGSFPYVEPDIAPPSRNPWNLDYTSGGSSGGAAAAVAAGLGAIAQGSDGGGSVRGPAFCCGVVGIKPARGRITQAPKGDVLNGVATDGPLARTVADAAALLDVLSGYVTGDPYWLPDPTIPFREVAQRAVRSDRFWSEPLRIAYSSVVQPAGAAHPFCQDAVHTTVKVLEQLGHSVEFGCPDFTDLVEPFIFVWQSSVGISGIPGELMQPVNRWLLSRLGTAGEYLRAVAAMQMIARRIVAFFDHYDVLVLPTYMHPPLRVGQWADLTPAEIFQNIVNWVTPCPPFNASGQPAIALPTGFTPEGVPVGVQLIGRPAAEATIIALAAQIEAARPWADKRPPIAE